MAGALAHQGASDSVEAYRQRAFIASKLALCVSALVAAPLLLAFQGAPSLLAVAAAAFALAPFGAVFIASRSGNLQRAVALSLIGLAGFSVCVALAAPAVALAALALLVLLPLEAAFIAAAPVALLSAAGACVAALFGVFALLDAPPAAVVPSALMLCGAAAYAGALVYLLSRSAAMQRRAGASSLARFEALADATGDLVLLVDRGGAVLGGASAQEVLDLTLRDLIGRGLFERVHVGDRPAFLKAISDAASSGGRVSADLRIRAGAACEGSGFEWAGLFARRVEEPGSPSACVMVVLRDISASRANDRVVEDARREAERASVWKDRFLANVSHELRTPLNAIIGFSEILADENLAPAEPERRREYAAIINGSGQHLLSVVNSILDISKIEAGSFSLLPEPFEIEPLIEQCCDMVRLKAEETNIDVQRDVSTDLVEVVADKRALKQILINLVSNAVKFTPANGRVRISARPEGTSLALVIEDTGIGIRSSDLARIGDPFFQAQSAYDRTYEGTGLGLSVVRGLVGLHGGEITVESSPDDGTRITVKLPLDCRQIPDAAKSALARIEKIARGPAGSLDWINEQKVKKIA